MTTLSIDQLANVTGGGLQSISPEVGQFWHGRTQPRQVDENGVGTLQSDSPSLWSRERGPEVDENGVGFARPVNTSPFGRR